MWTGILWTGKNVDLSNGTGRNRDWKNGGRMNRDRENGDPLPARIGTGRIETRAIEEPEEWVPKEWGLKRGADNNE